MAIYIFSTDDGEVVERAFPMGTCPASVTVGGRLAHRNRSLEYPHTFVKGTKTPVKRGNGIWPMNGCVASGVQPDQAQELRDFYKKHGMNVEVNKDRDPIYTSAKQRHKALKIRGIHDKNSYN